MLFLGLVAVSLLIGRFLGLFNIVLVLAEMGLLIVFAMNMMKKFDLLVPENETVHVQGVFGVHKSILKLPDGTEAPSFLTPHLSVFNREFRVDFTNEMGKPESIWIKPRYAYKPKHVDHALFLIERAALFERMRRGFNILNEHNLIVACDIAPEHGYVVETLENDDGSLDAIVACDVDAEVSRQDYDRAKEVHLIGRYHQFTGTMARPGDKKHFDGQAPLCRPVLKTVRIRQADTNANPFRPRSTEKGAAQWAWVDEMQAALAIEYEPHTALEVHAARTSAGAPLGLFFRSDWTEAPENEFACISAHGEGHRVIVGPPGSGKFTAAFAPLLLMADAASAVVFDVANGEAARVTAPWRRTLGPVVVIDPFGVSGQESGGLNPLDYLNADDPDVLQAAKRLTDALFIAPPGTSTEEYWNDQARDVLTAYLLHVATDIGEAGERTLRRVREIIRQPISASLLAAMKDNPIAGGVVRDVALNLIEASKVEADRNSYFVLQTLRANTAFLDLPAVVKATAQTSFDPRELRRQVSTLYVCLPEAQLGAVGRWLRLVYATIMEQVRERTAVPLHVLVDEFPALGRFDRVKDDMALVRKFGIHIHIATQSLTQLHGLYGDGWQTFMAAARYQQLLGVNDQMTADYFSQRLGKTTVRSTSTSHSRQTGSGSQSTTEGWVETDLMSPDELGRMHKDTGIVVVEGMNPLILQKLYYYHEGTLPSRLPKEEAAE